MKSWITTTCSAAALAMSAALAPAMAQNAQAPATTQQAPATNYSDAQLEKFVNASQKVAVISQEYTPKLQSTTDETTRQQVYQEADEKMVEAVRDEGMTVAEFNGINQAIQSDQELLQRVQNIAQ